MYHIYILQSIKNHRFYIGQTKNIEERLNRHNKGFVRSTKPFTPYTVIYSETFATRSESMRREKEIKSYKSGDAFKKLVNQ